MTAGPALLEALQAAVAGQHAAVWASGRAAAVLAGEPRASVERELAEHRATRDGLRTRIVALGGIPVAAAPAYVEPFPVSGSRGGRRLMAHVNTALAATYADLAAASGPEHRRSAAAQSWRAAERAVRWGAEPQPFPGA